MKITMNGCTFGDGKEPSPDSMNRNLTATEGTKLMFNGVEYVRRNGAWVKVAQDMPK